jgi:hypothetical protein
MTSTCKKSHLVEVMTLRCLNKYLFRDRKYNNILERNDLKIYMQQRMKIVNLYFEGIMMYFIAHKSCLFVKIRV